MKITDKMRLDWLQKSKKEICCIEGNIDSSWEEEGINLRQAIDAEINRQKKVRK